MSSTHVRAAACWVALCSLVAGATVVRFETLDDMARRVPVIVRGKAVRSVSGWDEAQHRIWTWTEVVVEETIKGTVPAVVLIKQPGGEVGAIGQRVEGAAHFVDGEECVLFLEKAPDEPRAFRVSSLSAGKISIVRLQGVDVATRDTTGLSFASPQGSRVTPVAETESFGAPAAFVARVKAAARAGR